jgi:AraC-like DNA-binding protein
MEIFCMDTHRNSRIIEYINNLRIHVMESGFCRLGSEWNRRDVCSPYTRLYFIYAGEGAVRWDGRRLPLRPGFCYLIPAGLTFDYACGSFLDQLYFHVNAYAADGCDLLSRLTGCRELPVPGGELADLLICYRSENLAGAFGLQAALQRAIARFVGSAKAGEDALETHSAFLRRLYPLVQQTLSSRTTRKMLADAMAMSQSTLAKRFKAETGMTLGRYIDNLLLEKARQLLVTTDDPIGVIAERLGFCDQFYFSRYFRQRQHETPSQYRRRLRVWMENAAE